MIKKFIIKFFNKNDIIDLVIYMINNKVDNKANRGCD